LARVGDVILTASDVDRRVLAMRLEDGVLDTLDSLTIHLSDTDAALGVARFLFGRRRLGQSWIDEDLPPYLSAPLLGLDKLELVDISGAAGPNFGNGRNYYRSSPWVSDDTIARLRLDLPPNQRGLVRAEGDPIWHFAPDYEARMERARTR
jgi:esterase/lipase superfamily enzyme